jgi:hypothetical protein
LREQKQKQQSKYKEVKGKSSKLIPFARAKAKATEVKEAHPVFVVRRVGLNILENCAPRSGAQSKDWTGAIRPRPAVEARAVREGKYRVFGGGCYEVAVETAIITLDWRTAIQAAPPCLAFTKSYRGANALSQIGVALISAAARLTRRVRHDPACAITDVTEYRPKSGVRQLICAADVYFYSSCSRIALIGAFVGSREQHEHCA